MKVRKKGDNHERKAFFGALDSHLTSVFMSEGCENDLDGLLVKGLAKSGEWRSLRYSNKRNSFNNTVYSEN